MAAADDSDLDRIAGAVDGDGDDIPQDHPIENPGEEEGDGSDPIAEPHPDEPGAPSDDDDVADSV